ncbi:MAG: FkbM family methyltransferase [Mucilaginibacter sp.]|nr:FkbM family methyltransferase [Mucilaginibacter sp.]
MQDFKIFKRIKNRLKPQLKLPLSREERKRIENLERFIPTKVNLYGIELKIVDSVTFLNSYNEIFIDEIYKFIPKTTSVIIDCGANIGLASLYFKMYFPAAKVIAYEPDPEIFNTMQYNMLQFGFNDVVCFNEAISNKDGTTNFEVEGGHSGMITQNKNASNVIQVKTVRLKTILENYENITFLKIDIEGHERSVFKDIADQLSKVDYLFLEYHSFTDDSQNLDEILSIISKAGMRYYIKEAYNKTFPFINREIFLKMDMLINIFCYR